ncbi:MAG: hypothetical protein OEQ18_07080 [Gammaproteobacteria bacterium]|nr:hypothetical protein [Gammaproteobacteria bacterium]
MTDKKIEELLPWHVNKTLEPESSRQVEEYLAGDADARADVEFLRAVRNTLKDQTVQSPGELGLKRFQKQLAETRQVRSAARQWWRPALAAAALVIVVQGGLLVNLWQAETYVPLGGDAPGGPVLQVELNEDATAAALQEALNRVGATIVDGPGALGIYRLRLSADANLDEAIAVLSANTEVVRHVSKE